MSKEFEKLLDKYLPKFEEQPQQVKLNLPKLKKIGGLSDAPKIQLPKIQLPKIQLPTLKRVK